MAETRVTGALRQRVPTHEFCAKKLPESDFLSWLEISVDSETLVKNIHTGIKKSCTKLFGGNARHWCFAPTCAHTRILREILFTIFFLSWLEISVDSETLVQKFHTGIKKNWHLQFC